MEPLGIVDWLVRLGLLTGAELAPGPCGVFPPKELELAEDELETSGVELDCAVSSVR